MGFGIYAKLFKFLQMNKSMCQKLSLPVIIFAAGNQENLTTRTPLGEVIVN